MNHTPYPLAGTPNYIAEYRVQLDRLRPNSIQVYTKVAKVAKVKAGTEGHRLKSTRIKRGERRKK